MAFRNHGTIAPLWIGATLILVSSLTGFGHASESPCPLAAWPAALTDDAALRDVCFVDPLHGWAVGDRGVIRSTADGGKTWHLSLAPIPCRLESVSFVDRQHGWVAGGWTHPGTHRSTGVLFETQDGGQSWKEMPGLVVPFIRKVKMVDARQGWLVADRSPVFSGGLFSTTDSGRTWNPLRAPSEDWQAANFRDARSGIAVSREGNVASVRGKEAAPIAPLQLGGRVPRGLQFSGQNEAWLTGDRGLLLASHDGGLIWQDAPSPLPAEARGFDGSAVACLGTHVWIAGSPGHCIWHSADQGRRWECQATGNNMPIAALTFIDERHGFAVGALGTILATADGGRNWTRQRSGGTRASLLTITLSAQEIPWELLASHGAGGGYLIACEVIGSREPMRINQATVEVERRTEEAISAAGGAAASGRGMFPLPASELRLPPSAVFSLAANEALKGQLVRSLRTWRPEVVVTHGGDDRDPLARHLAMLVREAVERAADEVPRTEVVGESAWRVKKIVAMSPPQSQGHFQVLSSQLLPRWSQSVAEMASHARALVTTRYQPSPSLAGFQLVVDRVPQGLGRHDLFSGLLLPAGGDARRSADIAAGSGSLDELRRAAQRRRNVQELVHRAAREGQAGTSILASLQELTSGLSPTAAGEVYFHLASEYQAAGHGELAADTFEQLVNQYPYHPLSEGANLRLLRYYTSGEVAWRIASLRAASPAADPVAAENPAEQKLVKQVSAEAPVNPANPFVVGVELSAPLPVRAGSPPQAIRSSPLQGGQVVATPAAAGVPSVAAPAAGGPQMNLAEKSLQLSRILERSSPSLAAEGELKLQLLSSYRRLGLKREADRMGQSLSSANSSDLVAVAAQAERWLAKPEGTCPKPLFICRRINERPKLDGRLDEGLWRESRPADLRSPAADDFQWPATVVMVYDAQYLYVGISCAKAAGVDYPKLAEPRCYDAPLGDQDRVELLFDIDRDYTSFWRMTVDHRGATNDACLDDPSWNPQWYVAADSATDSWTAECAIPWSQLAPEMPGKGHACGIGMQRIVPGRGFQSWTQPASPEGIGLGFGWILFE